MELERAKEIGTEGGCGLIVEALMYDFPGSIPCLRFENGTAVHAALYLPNLEKYLHWEDSNDDLVPVSSSEFEEALESFHNNFFDWEIEEASQLLVEITMEKKNEN